MSLSTADAFYGTYVSSVDSKLYNEYSQLAVVQDGRSITLTIVNDVQGDFDSFALVIPVPEVILEENVTEGDLLSPLQFSYEADVFQIPIRIGTLNSKEAQDLVIYAVSPFEEGTVGISNYPEFMIEDECLWDSENEEFGEYFNRQFDEGYDSQNNAAWTTEYAWGWRSM